MPKWNKLINFIGIVVEQW